MGGVRLALLQAADAGEVNRLIQRALPATAPGVAATSCEVGSSDSLIDDARLGLVLVAWSGATIVGTGTLIGQWVYNVCVEPAIWRRGIGTQVMHGLETHARRAGARVLGLFSNAAAVPFYAARGFEAHQAVVVYGQDAVEMYKALSADAAVRHEAALDADGTV